MDATWHGKITGVEKRYAREHAEPTPEIYKRSAYVKLSIKMSYLRSSFSSHIVYRILDHTHSPIFKSSFSDDKPKFFPIPQDFLEKI